MKGKLNSENFLVIPFIGLIIIMALPVSSIHSQVNIEQESALQDQVSSNFNYVHKADLNRAVLTVLLHDIKLIKNDVMLLYDSTPFASKGHVALNLPCGMDPNKPPFQVLVGAAPDLFSMPFGYVEQISNPPRSCIYHGQFGFGDPVTDVALKYNGDEEIMFLGPHSVTITTHESYIPKNETFMTGQHSQMID